MNVTITRLPGNPIIGPDIFGSRRMCSEAKNINGPTLIKVPRWIEDPLGKYYLYFAHHKGHYIRLAYSDDPGGPYTLYKPGVLHGEDCFVGKRHLASPDIFLDREKKELRMYFHAAIRGDGDFSDQGQTTYVAHSPNGIDFTADPTLLGPFYMRVFTHAGLFYAIAKNDNLDGILLRSEDGLTRFERGPTFQKGFRHCGLLKKGDLLHVFFTRAFEMQESILHSTMALEGDWMDWTLSEPKLVLKPEMNWEGANIPLKQSSYGSAKKASNAIRDPHVFVENGDTYMLYTVKGEKGIAIARLEGID